MWDRWFNSFPAIGQLELDVGQGHHEFLDPQNVSWLTRLVLPYDEQTLYDCLTSLSKGDYSTAAVKAIDEARKGCLLPDIRLLAGAFLLQESRFDEAIGELYYCYSSENHPGAAIRRIYPSLRIQLRISPTLMVPFYPNQFGAATMYALALWRNGQDGEALEVLKEMTERWGPLDEIRLLAGQIQLGRGETEKAISALRVSENVKRDALELSRNLHLALACTKCDQYRDAARALGPALDLVKDQINSHLHARARLLLAECYERCGLLVEALRASAHVDPDEVPLFVSVEMLAREERWVTDLGLLSQRELEQLANADLYQVYVPDSVAKDRKLDLLETTRDPLKRMQPVEISWRKRQIEERQIAEYKAAVAMGKPVEQPQPKSLSEKAVELKLRIARAKEWWPGRKASLVDARERPGLTRDISDAGFARFDFQGTREQSPERLSGEIRSALLISVGGTALLIAISLAILRTCVY